jgi:enterochelin esterase-like enzyme
MRNLRLLVGFTSVLLAAPLLADDAAPTTTTTTLTTAPSDAPLVAATAPATLPATAPTSAPTTAPTTAPATTQPFISWSNPPAEPLPLAPHHEYDSAAMKAKVGYSVYLPPRYGEAGNETRYPVVYWLHGLDATESPNGAGPQMIDDAIRAGKAPPMIVVYASGGRRSWYADSVDRQHLAETTIVRELVPLIDANYRTIGTRGGRAIQGFSMGGTGAIKFGLKYPELFSSVVAYAPSLRNAEEMAELPTQQQVYEVMFNADAAQFMNEHPQVLLDTGTADRVRDRVNFKLLIGDGDAPTLLRQLRAFHDRLTELKIEHEYTELPGVGHELSDLLRLTGVDGLGFADSHFEKPDAPITEPPTTQPF